MLEQGVAPRDLGQVGARAGAGDLRAVTWERGGHTCVLSAKGVPATELVALANWRGKGAIPF